MMEAMRTCCYDLSRHVRPDARMESCVACCGRQVVVHLYSGRSMVSSARSSRLDEEVSSRRAGCTSTHNAGEEARRRKRKSARVWHVEMTHRKCLRCSLVTHSYSSITAEVLLLSEQEVQRAVRLHQLARVLWAAMPVAVEVARRA